MGKSLSLVSKTAVWAVRSFTHSACKNVMTGFVVPIERQLCYAARGQFTKEIQQPPKEVGLRDL